ncbi:glycosyltransferase family 39 protein [Natronomonas halophila]|uniref:DUF7846 domain-containing protein n=1 Tax=Natronomonas halophila TaxID=2747817 RepID=UPI0015B3B557|nr:glycosyltransferase family 39 protein [Natronomonas halophila]QLD85103.1 glycosyltransferase family 39 protein [Natronomonas halophila]
MDAGRDRLETLVRGAGARERLLAAAIAVAAGLFTFLIAATIFKYHSINHDEGVYLQQASMILAGQLELHAGELADAFHPWFFIEDGGRLYPKYQPYPAVLFAAAIGLFGEPRVALAAVAAANVALVYLLASEALDRRVGVVAAAVFAAAPLSVVTTSVFLPYAPTTMLNLTFAVLYLRGVRRGHLPSALGAGLAIGLAFFGRPYTAVLFATPFILHALVAVVGSLRADGLQPFPDALRRNLLTAAGGLSGVALTLAYNVRITGAPFRFPYAVFAPEDGPGFGHRQILGHSLEYTPELAVETNAYVLWYFVTRWFTLGSVGTVCALAGVALVAYRLRSAADSVVPDIESPAAWTLGGVLLSVPLGNIAFWGNYNILGDMTDPTDGFISQFGPFYHFDLLVPLSVFAAVALVAGYRFARRRLAAGYSPEKARVALAIALVLTLPVVGVANAGLVNEPLERHAAYTDKYEAAYEPFENESFDNALVFVPTPYGEWQNHPFQSLRNDPGFDGPVVYALNRDPGEDFAVLDAYPDRSHYRYTYRGEWTPSTEGHVTPKLEPLDVREGERLAASTTVGIPDRVDRAQVRLTVDDRYQTYTVEDPGDSQTVDWELAGDGVRLRDTDREPLAVDGPEEVALTVTLVAPGGSTFTYRQEALVRADGEQVDVVWPPDRSVCPLVTDCGREGTYLPNQPDEHSEWVVFETRLEEGAA